MNSLIQTVTITSCTIYNIQQPPQPSHFTFLLISHDRNLLFQKTVAMKWKQQEAKAYLGLKISFSQHDKQIFVSIFRGKEPRQSQKLGEFAAQLDILLTNKTQFFHLNKESLVKLTIQPDFPAPNFPTLTLQQKSNTMEFIQKRQNFLKSLKQTSLPSTLNRYRSHVQLPHTPQFTKAQDLQKEEKHIQQPVEAESLPDKIKRLLAQTRSMKEEGTNFRSYMNQQSRQSSKKEYGTFLSQRRSLDRLPPMLGSQYQRNRIQYHEHYHIYDQPKPIQRSSHRKEIPTDILTLPGHTNDSLSMDVSQEETYHYKMRQPHTYRP